MTRLDPTGVPSRQAIQDAIDDARPQAGNTVVVTNANGEAAFTYPVPFPEGSNVVVVAAGGNSELVWVRPESITRLGFTARFRQQTGANDLIASGNVRIYWIATKQS